MLAGGLFCLSLILLMDFPSESTNIPCDSSNENNNTAFCKFCALCLNVAESCECASDIFYNINTVTCHGNNTKDFPIIWRQNDSQCKEYKGDNYTLEFQIYSYMFSEIPSYAIQLNVPLANSVSLEFWNNRHFNSSNVKAFDGLTGAGVKEIFISGAHSLQRIPFDALSNINYACPISLMISGSSINQIEPGAFSDLTKRAGGMACTWDIIMINSNIDINELPTNAFSDMTINNYFDLSNNFILSIERNSFANMTINELDFSENSLGVIHDSAFVNLSIQNLILSNNPNPQFETANVFLNVTINQFDLSNCFLSKIPYGVLQNIKFGLVDSDFIQIDFTGNQISTIDPWQFSNLKSSNKINLILTGNAIAVLNNFSFAGGNWNQIKMDNNNLQLIESHAFANATFQDLSIDLASSCLFPAQISLEDIYGTLRLGLFKNHIASQPDDYYNSSSYTCFKNPVPLLCPENAKSIVTFYCTDLLDKMECCRDFQSLTINFPNSLDQFQDYGKLPAPKIKSIDTLLLRWNSGIMNNQGFCFDASDFQQINIAAVDLWGQNVFICENALLSLANVATNLSLSLGNLGFSKFPLTLKNLTKLLHLQIDSLIQCDCFLANNFHDFVRQVNVEATCTTGDSVANWINDHYENCSVSNTTDQEQYDTLNCTHYCSKTTLQTAPITQCSAFTTAATSEGNTVEDASSSYSTLLPTTASTLHPSNKKEQILIAASAVSSCVVALCAGCIIWLWRRNRENSLRLKFWRIWGQTAHNENRPPPPMATPPSMDIRGNTCMSGRSTVGSIQNVETEYITLFSSPYASMPYSRKGSIDNDEPINNIEIENFGKSITDAHDD